MCEVICTTQRTDIKARYYVETHYGNNHGKKKQKSTIICEVQKIQRFSMPNFSAGLLLPRIKKKMIQPPSSLEERVYLSFVSS